MVFLTKRTTSPSDPESHPMSKTNGGSSTDDSMNVSSSSSNGSAAMSASSTSTSTSSLPSLPLPLAELASFVPLRLTASERSLLNVLEQALNVSEYTDHVDVSLLQRQRGLKTVRILDGILEVCHIATGLCVATGRTNEWASLINANSKNHEHADGISKDHNSTGTKFLRHKLLKKRKAKKTNNKKTSSSEDDTDSASSPWAARDPVHNEALLQTMFEIGRRHKVLNPSSMRATYGKLMYLLQDSQSPSVAKTLGFTLYKELLLVKPYLEEHNCLALLDDERLVTAIQFIPDRDIESGKRLDRQIVQDFVSRKKKTVDELVHEYSNEQHATSRLAADEVRRVIESLDDAIAYIESNVRPVRRMLRLLQENFDPDNAETRFSLALTGGTRSQTYNSSSSNSYARYGLSAYGSTSNSYDGPTLSHNHATQYVFVWQSLLLWCHVMRHMHKLWVCADEDLLSTTSQYHLYNTGQGLQRVQACPRVRKIMSSLLNQTQQQAGGSWVGLSVVHLGDRDVPNALIFIDKYIQIPRFLNPIVNFIESLEDDLSKQPFVQKYIEEEFGSVRRLRMTVLADYFKHGFDGSGDDGGSCIDGRLTSSWNWTSKIAKKSYYHAFLLSGFQGFDGSEF